MFKNMKHIALLALPVMALSLTSCGEYTAAIPYDTMRNFAADHYDEHALDTVPADYVINFNKMEAKINVTYSTPTGGTDSFVISSGYNGIHITLKDHYVFSLSSTMIDMIERYYSDFVSFVVKLQEEPPLELIYELIGNNCSKVDLTAKDAVTGKFVIRIVQTIVSMLDSFTSTFGYLPNPWAENPEPVTNPILIEIYEQINTIGMFKKLLNPERSEVIFGILNGLALTISESSESHGDVFNTYVTTDSYGFINKLDFNFKSSFNISGIMQFKKYDSDTPEEGDRPTGLEAPYSFSLNGSLNYDFDISAKY